MNHKCGCGLGVTGFGVEFYECESYPRCLGGQGTYHIMKEDHDKQVARFLKEGASWTPIQRVRMVGWLTTNFEKLEKLKLEAWGGSL